MMPLPRLMSLRLKFKDAQGKANFLYQAAQKSSDEELKVVLLERALTHYQKHSASLGELGKIYLSRAGRQTGGEVSKAYEKGLGYLNSSLGIVKSEELSRLKQTAIETFYNKARVAIDSGDRGNGISILQLIRNTDDTHRQARYDLGILFRESQAPEDQVKALEFFAEARRIDPTYQPLEFDTKVAEERLYTTARQLIDKMDVGAGIELLERLVWHSRHRQANYDLGILSRDLGRPEEALDWFNRALRIDPEYEPTRYDRDLAIAAVYTKARIFVDDGKPQDAIKLLEKIVELVPHRQAYYDLGILYRDSGEPEKALLYFDSALDIDSNYVPAYFDKAVTLEQLGKVEEAKEVMERKSEIELKIEIENKISEGMQSLFS